MDESKAWNRKHRKKIKRASGPQHSPCKGTRTLSSAADYQGRSIDPKVPHCERAPSFAEERGGSRALPRNCRNAPQKKWFPVYSSFAIDGKKRWAGGTKANYERRGSSPGTATSVHGKSRGGAPQG